MSLRLTFDRYSNTDSQRYEEAIEKPAEEEPEIELKTVLLNAIQDVENELKALRKRIKSKDLEEDMGEEEVDRLKYIQKELQALMGEP